MSITGLVGQWVSGSLPNNGMVLKQVSESVTNQIAFVASDLAGEPDQWPKLSITWTEAAAPQASQAGDRRYWTYTSEQLDDRLSAKVNVGNGNLLVSAHDAKVAGTAGLDLVIDRYYNSSTAASTGGDTSRLGPGWSHSLGGSVRLEFPDGDADRVLFFGPSGVRARFDRSAAGNYLRAEPGLDGVLRYDAASNTLRVEMFDKHVYVFAPFAAGQPVSSGQLLEYRDKQGNKLAYSYNTDGTLDQVTDTRGRTAVMSYRGDGMLGSIDIEDPTGATLVTYSYDYTATTPARLASSEVSYVNTTLLPDTDDTEDGQQVNLGKPTTYDYDANGRLSQIADPRESDPATAGEGGTTTFSYTSAGELEELSRLTDDPDLPDSTSSYTYTTDVPAGSACAGFGDGADHTTVVDGERTDVADTTSYCVDTHDRVVHVIDAAGHHRHTGYTTNSNVDSYDASGLASGGQGFTLAYKNDNPESVTMPGGGTAAAAYTDTDSPHFPTAMWDFATGGDKTNEQATWSYAYDPDGNLIQAAADPTPDAAGSGDEIEFRYCWDGTGQLQRVDPPDAAGANSVALDQSTTTGCGTANQGNDTLYSYNTAGELTGIDPPGAHRSQSFTYDALSRVASITDGRGVVTTFSYDAVDRVVAEDFDATNATDPPADGPDSTEVTWVHDPAGNLTKMRDLTGQTDFDYDELNRKSAEWQDVPEDTKRYGYDAADNLVSFDVSHGPDPVTYTYNNLNLVTELDDSDNSGSVVDFGYDAHDQRIKTDFSMPDGNDVIQRGHYDDAGHLNCLYSYRENQSVINETDPDPACPAATTVGLLTFTGYGYTRPAGGGDPARETDTRYQVTGKGNATTTLGYDAIDRLTGAESAMGGASLRSFDYAYDRHSNLTRRDVTGTTPGLVTGTTHFAYNDAEELCWTGPTSGSCGTAPSGATSYTYDANGALATGSDGLSLGYNLIGQTTTIDPAGTPGPVSMVYEGITQDRRAAKDDQLASYGYTGLSTQYDGSSADPTDRFLRTPDGDLVAQVDPTDDGNIRYYLTDGQKTVVATIGVDDTVRRYLYEPYGTQIRTWTDTTPTANTSTGTTPPDGSETAPANTNPDTNPWRYASGYYDTETGLLKYGTRYYNPTLARWTQPDPQTGTPQNPLTLNPYLYAASDPANRADTTGRSWLDFLGLAQDLGTLIADLARGDSAAAYYDALGISAGTLAGLICAGPAAAAGPAGEFACYGLGSVVSYEVTATARRANLYGMVL